MEKLRTLLLAAALIFSAAGAAQAIDFKIKGQWNMGFAVGETSLIKNYRNAAGEKIKGSNEDTFAARQRLLLQMDAVASESLSGTVMFHIGPQQWGRGNWQGGALGADGNQIVKVRQAYIDWLLPNTSLRTRMGIQNFALPNAAGGSAVFDLRAAAVNAHYYFNDNVGLTALWFRPFNDNYTGPDGVNRDPANYLDNMDLFALMLPLHFEGVDVTPWVMYGIRGRNTGASGVYGAIWDGRPDVSMTPYLGAQTDNASGLNVTAYGRTTKAYGNMFWAGLPVVLKAFDPWNIEFDINYGYVEGMGRFRNMVRGDPGDIRRGSSKREGWPRLLWNTKWIGVFRASSPGTAAVMTATSKTVPNACQASPPMCTRRPSWAMAICTGRRATISRI